MSDVGVLILLVLSSFPVISNAAPASNKSDFSAFQDIVVSNIFNAKRSPSYVPGDQPDQRRERDMDFLALTGTLIDEKGPRAFFYGNRSEYQKVVKPADKIADLKVSAVEYGSVTLKSETNETKVPVGMQLSRKEGGTWRLGPRTDMGDAPSFASSGRSEERDRGDRRGDYRRSDRSDRGRFSFGRRDNGNSSDSSAFPNGGPTVDLLRTDPALSGAGPNNGTASPDTRPSGRAETPEETLQRLARQREEQDKKP